MARFEHKHVKGLFADTNGGTREEVLAASDNWTRVKDDAKAKGKDDAKAEVPEAPEARDAE